MRVDFALAACAALALAGGARADETVEDFVTRYELALDRGDTELLRGVNVEFSELEVVAADDQQARIRLVRRDRFTDALSGQRVERELALDRTLHRFGGLWRIAPTSASR